MHKLQKYCLDSESRWSWTHFHPEHCTAPHQFVAGHSGSSNSRISESKPLNPKEASAAFSAYTMIGHHSGGWLGGSDEGGLTLMYSEHGLQKSFESL